MNSIRPLLAASKRLYLLNSNCSFSINSVRRYAFKTDLKIKWIAPPRVSCISPEISGDLDSMSKIDNQQYQLDFKNCKELEDANDLVKKLFTLEFAPRRKATQIYIKSLADQIRRHPLDIGSAEAKIARWTGCIRSFQERMDNFPRNKRMKVILKELIDKRKKLLKRVRKWDYKRFEWLLDSLNIVYKPEPLKEKTYTRKMAMVKLTDIYCDNVTNDRLDKYRRELEAQQPAFLEGKISTLEFIRNEQQECGIEVTISQEEIDAVKKQLQELHQKLEESRPKEEE